MRLPLACSRSGLCVRADIRDPRRQQPPWMHLPVSLVWGISSVNAIPDQQFSKSRGERQRCLACAVRACCGHAGSAGPGCGGPRGAGTLERAGWGAGTTQSRTWRANGCSRTTRQRSARARRTCTGSRLACGLVAIARKRSPAARRRTGAAWTKCCRSHPQPCSGCGSRTPGATLSSLAARPVQSSASRLPSRSGIGRSLRILPTPHREWPLARSVVACGAESMRTGEAERRRSGASAPAETRALGHSQPGPQLRLKSGAREVRPPETCPACLPRRGSRDTETPRLESQLAVVPHGTARR